VNNDINYVIEYQQYFRIQFIFLKQLVL